MDRKKFDFRCKHRSKEDHGKYWWCILCGSSRSKLGEKWRHPIVARPTLASAFHQFGGETIGRWRRCLRDSPGGGEMCLRKVGHKGQHAGGGRQWIGYRQASGRVRGPFRYVEDGEVPGWSSRGRRQKA